ncbi:toll-like receptor 6 [Amyelois transitella]|uniref:toll-like receptor 6 n=1 Tax=Amyelois transitella TaxID=680683 RepID=UPI00067C067B|nr:toll-like receptor 6 [Amyelois transitella]
MTLRLIWIFSLFSCMLTKRAFPVESQTCLTGYMTDVQNWVDEKGDFTDAVEPEFSIDLSTKANAVRVLRENFEDYITVEKHVKYLSLAKCKLARVPTIFNYQSFKGHHLAETLEYMTLYGNSFMDTSSTGDDYQMSINATELREVDTSNQFGMGRSIWSIGFENTTFIHLKELDLRACSIETIGKSVFYGMPNLKALYLGENNIHEIENTAFDKLTNLVHLDISRNAIHLDNMANTLLIRQELSKLKNLVSIDMSFSLFHPKTFSVFSNLGPKVQRLSLCWTGCQLSPAAFNNTSIRYLDVSGNLDVLNDVRVLRGLENSLQVLYANDVKLKDFDVFNNMRQLEILKLTDNELVTIKRDVAMSLRKLQVLDLDKNRFATWLHPIFAGMRSLRLLSLRENNINILSIEMMNDIKDISYIGLSENIIVCNCHTRELIEIAAMNELMLTDKLIYAYNNNTDFNFNIALKEYNEKIIKRTNISFICDREDACIQELNVSRYEGNVGKFLLLDYQTFDDSYSCLQVFESKSIPFMEVQNCNAKSEPHDINKGLDRGVNLLLLLIIPGIMLPFLFLMFMFRRRIRYFFVTMKNSATLSLISKDEGISESKIYNYDVFVSYCHDDRAWMLDQLLPHLEMDCNVSVCLHERDFQVGLSILENIVSCMDRSRTITLVISRQFLLSQWCQFEMHLAQHRLLETRREDLMLILLEDIPRRLRPNTLHYLMLTKTYIVWPKEESEQALFWRRLKKSVVTQRNKLNDNVTFA